MTIDRTASPSVNIAYINGPSVLSSSKKRTNKGTNTVKKIIKETPLTDNLGIRYPYIAHNIPTRKIGKYNWILTPIILTDKDSIKNGNKTTNIGVLTTPQYKIGNNK